MPHAGFGRTLLISALWASAARADTPEPTPRPTDLIERAETHLAQLPISVSGPPEIVRSLVPADFFLKVNFRRVHDFVLDRFCAAPGTAAGSGPGLGPGTYLFYFDQPHLTLGGRARSIDIAQELVHELAQDGGAVMIVSNARRMAVVQELTQDEETLLSALRRLENDRTQWDSYAEQEDARIEEIVRLLNDDQLHRAIAEARSCQRAERLLADKTLRRLAVIVGRLADLPPPATVFYFADTIRSNAGEHYLTFFGAQLRKSNLALTGIATDALVSGLPFDRVANEAAAHGVRFYTVLARGLITPMDRTPAAPQALIQTKAVPVSSRLRFRDAQNTLANLATETGGSAFLRGETGKRIATRVHEDSSCVYVASFDATGFARDAPLRVIVKSRRDDVELRTRGRLVLQSREARLASRLLGAFSMERGSDFELELGASVIPIGFDDGRYRALLQVSVPGTSLPNAAWDLGASLVHRDQVFDEVSGRLSVARPGVSVVLEHEVILQPGLNEVVAVAHEVASDFVLSEHLRIDWPAPDLERAVGAPIALVQPTPGAFLRDNRTRTSGSLARSLEEPIDASRPTVLMSLVCRSQVQKGTLSIGRILSGSATLSFPLLEFDLGEDLCAQVRDLIPEETLAPGAYSYEVLVSQDGAPLHRASLDFRVADPIP